MTGTTIAGDVRLDNRGELRRALGLDGEQGRETSDLGLVQLAFDRWGDACPEKLLGDFAFVVRDDRTGRAFAARDHLGAKPFYYRASRGGLAFATRASAIPAIDGLSIEINPARIADVFFPALECADRTSTFYSGITRLPAGHRLTFDAGRVTVARYWTPDPSREIRLADDAGYVEAFRAVFGEAVRCRLPGPAAAMLSGGLDSSAIVGFARPIARSGGAPLTTISAMTDDPNCEESNHIRAVLGLPGLDPISFRPGDVGSYRGEIEAFVSSIEEPFDATMLIPLLVYASARRRGFSAVLDGVDGDSVASHEPDILAWLLRTGAWGAAIHEAWGLARFYRDSYPPWSSASRLLATHGARAFSPALLRAARRPLREARDIQTALAESIISPEFVARIQVPDRLRELWSHRKPNPGLTPSERQAEEIGHPQIAAALERYHRVAASQGIEARHPYFDKRVVEFCLAIPWEQKLRDGWSKHIVRRATEGLIPEDVSWRRGRWVRLGGRFLNAAIRVSAEFLEREFSGDTSALAEYVDIAKVRKLLDRHRSGDVEGADSLWTVAVLSSWLRKNGSMAYNRRARSAG